MKGTIRIIGGLLLVMGGVGGIETSTEMLPLDSLAIAIAGLVIMASGAIAANREYN